MRIEARTHNHSSGQFYWDQIEMKRRRAQRKRTVDRSDLA